MATVGAVGYGQEILDGLWRFTAVHPEWEDGDDWEPVVAWWAVQTDRGLLLVDPLVDDWDELDGLIEHGGGCAGVTRTCHWHQRSITEVSDRYAAAVWALPALADLLELDVRHVLVGHEPLVLGDGPDALADALTA